MLDKVLYFGQYIVAFAIVNLILPRLMFARKNGTLLSNFFAYFIEMVLLVIIVGYLLVLLKIFEIAAILGVFLFFIFGRTFIAKSRKKRKDIKKEVSFWLYDYTDGIIDLPELIKKRFSEWKTSVKKKVGSLDKAGMINFFIALALILYSGYLHLYDAFINTAPAMSDSYTTLAWIKYIEKSILFHDGIYPQGFHIYQAFLQMFSGLDPLFILRFTGPVNAILIILGIYFTVSYILKNKAAGIVAAAVFGLFGTYLTGSVDRLAATNSQEFAFVFIMPCFYFLYKYLMEKDKKDLYVAVSALTVIGLVHSLAFAFAVFGAVVLLFAFIVTSRGKGKMKAVLHTFIAGVVSSVVMLIPFGIGFLLGHEFHSSSIEYATLQNTAVTYPKLIYSDYAVMVCMFLLLIAMIAHRKKPLVSGLNFFFLLGGATFCLYYFGGALTNSVLISSRSTELYALVSPLVIGAGFFTLVSVFNRLKYGELAYSIICAGLIAGLCFQVKPAPIIPYKMEYNSFVDQYLRISKNFRATEWLIVSQEEGYALVLGKGWHLMTQDFLKNYNPDNGNLIGDDSAGTKINVPNVFIYIEKNIYPTYKTMTTLAVAYARREKERVELAAWMDEYNKINGKQEIYYEDENLIIYHIVQKSAQSEISDKVLGPQS